VKENVAPAPGFPSADAALMPANASGSREGDGVFAKVRALSFCGSFIRIPAVARGQT